MNETNKKNLERQLEKEKRQREKAERREQELEAEQQREQTKIQREQCKQRRSQKENQKKSELELEQKEKREKLLVSWHVAFLVCLVYLVVFSGLQVCKKYLTEELTAILEWNERNWLLSFLVLFGYLFIFGFIYSLTLAVESRIEYHEWINCYDAYPPTPFLFRLF